MLSDTILSDFYGLHGFGACLHQEERCLRSLLEMIKPRARRPPHGGAPRKMLANTQRCLREKPEDVSRASLILTLPIHLSQKSVHM